MHRGHPESESCFGPYLSLFEGRRTCLFCLRNNPALRPIELTTLINLCLQRNSSINISKTPRIHTIAGYYTGFSGFPFMPRCKLVQSTAITTHLGKTLSEKEHAVIYGNTRSASASINHHPLIPPEDESDISPNQDYISPESPKQISHRYISVVALPYLVSSRQQLDTGVLCTDCILAMLFHEADWKRTQDEQSWGRNRPRASMQRVDLINNARRAACKTYTTCSEAHRDAQELKEKGRGEAGMSIQEHRLTHSDKVMSKAEKAWRETFDIAKVPRGSLLRLQQYS